MAKPIMLTIFFCFISQVSFAGDLGQILRDANGAVLGFTLFEARNACPSGTRMPTLREFAHYGQAKGAKGILEVNQVDPRKPPAGYNSFDFYNVEDGSNDAFYYNAEGFQRRPDDEYGNLYFWSSSSMRGYGTIYMGNLGAVGVDGAVNQKKFVTCLPNNL